MDRLRKAFEEVREGMPGGWPDERYGQSGAPGQPVPPGPDRRMERPVHPARPQGPTGRPVNTGGDRPGSLWESGSVGEPQDGRDAERPRNPNRSQRSDPRRPQVLSIEEQEWQKPSTERPRQRVEPVVTWPQTEADRLAAALRDPASLRTAVLLREVLDPPLALRDERGRGSS
ncbi:MAG TPA: hypothetical protein VGT61_00315 [Thermomicrobiales bacterium]|nr:hypothetical protein [Thermomicrobiales bacterium]